MQATINFTKMQGLGNDFIILDSRKSSAGGGSAFGGTVENRKLDELAIEMCDRHFGVGADGLIIVWPSKEAHYRMQIFNPDGSEPEMCGNGIRCFARYVYEEDKLKEEVISVETKAGIIVPAVIVEKGKVIGVEVDMGIPIDEGVIKLQGFDFKKINMGNPHAVAFVEHLDQLVAAEIGPIIELDSHFKNRTNVEFVRVINDREIEIKVWERGAGETLACGTGACAAVVAASILKKTGRRVVVSLPGGKLDIEWQTSDNHVLMRGPAEKVFQGTYFSS